MPVKHPQISAHKGRGAISNPGCRYDHAQHEAVDDGWSAEEDITPLRTTISVDASRSVIARNQSPDVPFTQSINPYRGCEHGCVYCFARPTHAYLGLSPGLDFESRLLVKADATRLLREELSRPGYRCQTIAFGTNTDPYQPIEREWRVTRQLLEVLEECNHPVSIVTKSALVERDLDLLAEMASRRLAEVAISVTTLDRDLARRMEPRAAAPQRRLQTVRRLREAGIPVSVLIAPVIPMLNDAELETVLDAAAEAGANAVAYVLLRLPLEVRDLFYEWLQTHYPLKAARIIARIRDTRGGRDYQAQFGTRMRGQGAVADLIAKRFQIACRRLGLVRAGAQALDTDAFRRPSVGAQMDLF